MGVDWLVNVVGVYLKYLGNFIIIDFGMVIMFDVVVEDGVYEGGIICLGVNFFVEVLYMVVVKLLNVVIEKFNIVIGMIMD